MAGPGSRNHPSAVLNRARRVNDIAETVFPAADSKLNMGTLFKFVKFETSFGGTTDTKKQVVSRNLTQAHIALPLPENITDTLSLAYDTVDLGAVAAGIQSGEAVSDAFSKSGASEAVKTFAGRVGGDAEFLARTLAQVSGSVAGALNLAAGNVPNPFTTAVFKNVELRRHNLNFRLTPETPEDSEAIQKIITRFKKESLPVGQGLFLSMPSEVEITFFGTNALFGFARCVIQGITVNYNPSNQPAFFKNTGTSLIGAPQAVELQLQLSEIEQLRGDVFDVTYGGDVTILPNQAVESLPRGEREGNGLRDNVRDRVSRFRGT